MEPPKVRKVADYTLLKSEIRNFQKYKPELFFKNLYEMQNYVEPLSDQGCIATALVAAVMLCFFLSFSISFLPAVFNTILYFVSSRLKQIVKLDTS